ncbi:hypothetical protein D3C71_1864110 [compost metagenome]
MLHHAVQVHQVAIDVVQHLHLGRLGPCEQQSGAPGEGFDVAGVLGKMGENLVGQTALAAQPGNDRFCHL